MVAPTRFVIDRSTWLRGEGRHKSVLLRSSNRKRCVLGFYLAAAGIPDAVLRDHTDPMFYGYFIPAWMAGFAGGNSPEALNLMELNDDERIDEETREREIQRQCEELGIAVSFVDPVSPEVQ